MTKEESSRLLLAAGLILEAAAHLEMVEETRPHVASLVETAQGFAVIARKLRPTD